MRALVYGLSPQLGGVESFFINYYIAMRKNNLDIVCDAIGIPNCVLKEDIELFGGEVYSITGEYKEFFKNFFLINASRYDFLWANLVDASDITIIKIAKEYGMKVIVHSHSSSIMVSGLYGKYRKFRHIVNRKLLDRYADGYWACSDLAARWMFSKKITSKHLDRFIPNAIAAEKYRYCAKKRKQLRESNRYGKELLIGYIGRFSFEKNPLFAIKVFEEIKKNRPNAILFMCGTGDMESDVEKYIKENSITGVELLGVCKDINEKMQMLDCVVIPSLFEGMPMVALEAQAAGLHVFASKGVISEQTKIVPEVNFINLKDGAKRWADIILNTKLTRRDTFEDIVKAGFEIDSASINLYKDFQKILD